MSQRRLSPRPANQRRPRGQGFVRFMRGLVMESLGVAVLAGLYLTMQAAGTPEQGAAGQAAVDSPTTPAGSGVPFLATELSGLAVELTPWWPMSGDQTAGNHQDSAKSGH